MQSLIGVWRGDGGGAADAGDRTIIETYEDGWAWSLSIAPGVRQIAVMIDGTTTHTSRGRRIADTYLAELNKTRQLRALITNAELTQAWACDASMHTAREFAGPQFMLVGDAATCIDPLSSFGVKKALSSAWLAATAVHTALIDERRRQGAFDFFAAREREVYSAELARTEEYAQRALAHHDHEFWRVRGADPVAPPPPPLAERLLRSDRVRAAHERLRTASAIDLRWQPTVRFAKTAFVRGREIVIDDALEIGAGAVRFAGGIDLVTLGALAHQHRDVPALYDVYCRTVGEVALPRFLASLSLLVAEGLLEQH
jgi:hypothetical protein